MKLNSYIDIDIFGACGKKSCQKQNSFECDNMLRNTYKFYIAFENAVCKDYITEKFERALKQYTVPIVLSDWIYRYEILCAEMKSTNVVWSEVINLKESKKYLKECI